MPAPKLGNRINGAAGRHPIFQIIYDGVDKPCAIKIFDKEGPRDEEYDKNWHILSTLSEKSRSLEADHAEILFHHSIAKVFSKKTYDIDGCSRHCIVLQLEGQSMETQLTSAEPPSCLEGLEYTRQLIGGLSCLHLVGYHNDINTDNTWERLEGGGYVIGDFGEFEKIGSKICNREGYSQYAPLDPPDRYLDGSFDVASLACVILEFLVWVTPCGDFPGGNIPDGNIPAGVQRVLQFREEREADQRKNGRGKKYVDLSQRFYIRQESGSVELSASVKKWLVSLAKALEGRILEVVKVLQKMLHPDPDERPTAREAFILFDDALQQIKEL